jgi:lipopolysaccharide transport system ATP-binding protein
MNRSVAIKVEGLGKRYRITHGSAGYRTLRETLSDIVMSPIRRLRHGSADSQVEDFWALKDVSLEVEPGEVVGVVGRNGAGKSTFLKVLSRITRPTTGRVTLEGRVGSLLEVGTGFHPELSGRENIYLNGAILGMSRREITAKFDEIVEFSEISQFLDTPVKRYSSGMYVRLAFAVAAHLEPEILLVDEVLAVGDAAFQRKCMGKMGQVARQGRTILFVSHNMAAITRLCQRALWFDQGRLRESGPAERIVVDYLASGCEDAGEVTYHDNGQRAPGSEYVKLEAIRVRGNDGQITPSIDIRMPFALEVQYRVLRSASNMRVGVRLLASDGTVLLSSTDMDGVGNGEADIVREPGVYVSRCDVPGDFLNFGQYFVSVGCDFPMVKTHFAVDQGLAFRVEQTGGVGGHINDGRTGMLRMRLPWNVQRIDQ